MVEYTMEIPSIAESQLTGYYGAALADYRGVKYRVEFHADKTRITRNGYPVAADTLPKPVYKRAVTVRQLIAQANGVR